MLYSAILFSASVGAGAIAASAGFGIGSVLTPLLALELGGKAAVPLVAIPHLVATVIRFLTLRGHLDRGVFLRFGLASAAGGFAGAFLLIAIHPDPLTVLLGSVLVLAGLGGLTGWSDRLRFRGPGAWIAGGASGFLGGIVGNQGGIRAAALIPFGLSKEAFVATTTAVAIVVDGARIPVYLWRDGAGIAANSNWLVLILVGVLVGTAIGTFFLKRVPETAFRRVVSGLILGLGLSLLGVRRS
ncbi:MAG: TSUP family transporter [Bdellovibrionales bacterium]|nr:TSUP family transporter [Bdellovibrionales bacterium]